MNSFPMEVGRVVFSKAGRDQGHYFVVVEVLDENHVAIANGCQRKVDNPKKKKIKHLVAKPEILEECEGDTEMIEDFVTLAVNEAINKAIKTSEEEMGAITSGLNIPGMPGMF